MIKSVSRQQTVMSLSSCEAELVALTQACQESLGILQLVAYIGGQFGDVPLRTIQDFLNRDIEQMSESSQFRLYTDSMAAYQVLLGDGLSRRTRHLDISVGFLQKLVRQQIVLPEWISTDEMPADLLTKCLGKAKVEYFRMRLGIEEIEMPREWQDTTERLNLRSLEVKTMSPCQVVESFMANSCHVLVVELCTEVGFAPAHLKRVGPWKIFVLQSRIDHFPLRTEGSVEFFLETCRLIRETCPGCIVLGWLSPPCTGGSPVQWLKREGIEHRLQAYWKEFLEFLLDAGPILKVCDLRFVELSLYCSYWSTHEMQCFVADHAVYMSKIDRCLFLHGRN